MPAFNHDGLTFNYADRGAGLPIVFQHGLAADVSQPMSLLMPPPGFRLLSMDCRAHGETQPIGEESKISLASFADDLCVFLDHLSIDQAIVGGISMGAAVTLNFTLRYPERVVGLILSRPAWLAGPKTDTVDWCNHVAKLIRRYGASRGQQEFMQSAEYAELCRSAPDSAAPLLRQFELPRASEAVARLERIPPDSPCQSLDQLGAIRMPTLIMANPHDTVHPLEYGHILARAIPGAVFREMTPKALDPVRHQADVQKHIEEYLRVNFPAR